MDRPNWAPVGIDLSVPSASRIYDFYLGGSHNFRIDRQIARNAIEMWPELPQIMQENRAFLRRAVRYLAEAGIDQFIDIGSGIPTAGNVHEVAREVNPEARVVYVDCDPVAIAHSRAILAEHTETVVVQADLRNPESITNHENVRAAIDFTKPVGILIIAVLHFLDDSAKPADLIARLCSDLASGSYLAISHAGANIAPERAAEHVDLYKRTPTPMTMRTHDQVEALFGDFDLVAPGLVGLTQWRSEGPPSNAVPGFAGVGRKP
ncbi:SAM-dependent methyltransferase [Antrihabitans cavernicola]|uniref:SAM-dependent methyltransferase n=1 Tax=Antrihabitans cavernicola TaxID=2495913 RepID=A0A5A7SFK2_9NOCA|nr:SAM-dependent methyltransferase [Spelaeibacter cavernicola]KAA0023021.1 hypothetical protein FOY51_11030 [Spelaeibacter cavernicola]